MKYLLVDVFRCQGPQRSRKVPLKKKKADRIFNKKQPGIPFNRGGSFISSCWIRNFPERWDESSSLFPGFLGKFDQLEGTVQQPTVGTVGYLLGWDNPLPGCHRGIFAGLGWESLPKM